MLPTTDEQKRSMLDLRSVLETCNHEDLPRWGLRYLTLLRYLYDYTENMASTTINLSHILLSEDEQEQDTARGIMIMRLTEVLGA